MKPSYAPDNTRSSIAVILLLAAGVTIVALLLGLSDKPDVESIGVAISNDEATALLADAPAIEATTQADEAELDPAFSVPAPEPTVEGATASAGVAASTADGEVLLDEAGDPIPADETASTAGTADTGGTADAGGTASTVPAVTAIPIPEPTPTPEIVAAVEPTPVPESDDDLAALEAPARITAGTAAGSFFTGVFEDEGATIANNEVRLTLNEDGTGSFTGSLDMTMLDETRVTMSMSGPFEWSASNSPQVVAELAGSYVSDSLVDGEDLATTNAELTITSLGSGSGALCATDSTCFGFRFPAQTGF